MNAGSNPGGDAELLNAPNRDKIPKRPRIAFYGL